MIDLIKKTLFTGVGLAFLTKEKLEELSKTLIELGKLSEQEGKKLIEELSKKAEDARNQIKGQVEKSVKDTLDKMNLATKADLLNLEKKLQKLENALKKEKAKG